MGGVTSDWEDPGRFTPQDGPLSGKDIANKYQGMFIYPPLDAAMKSVGLEEVYKYVLHYQNIVAKYISTQAIL